MSSLSWLAGQLCVKRILLVLLLKQRAWSVVADCVNVYYEVKKKQNVSTVFVFVGLGLALKHTIVTFLKNFTYRS